MERRRDERGLGEERERAIINLTTKEIRPGLCTCSLPKAAPARNALRWGLCFNLKAACALCQRATSTALESAHQTNEFTCETDSP